MKSQLQIAGGVRQIEADYAASRVTGASDALHIKRLTCGVVHASQNDQGDLVSFALDYGFDVVLANARFAGAWNQLNQRCSRIKAMKPNLRLHRVLIRGECSALDDNLVTFLRGAVKRN